MAVNGGRDPNNYVNYYVNVGPAVPIVTTTTDNTNDLTWTDSGNYSSYKTMIPIPPAHEMRWAPRQRPPAVTLPENAASLLRPKPDPRRAKSEWFRVENAVSDDGVDIYIFDEITDPIMSELFGIGVSALGFVRELQEHKGKTINLHIDSPGGSVYQGLGIYNALRHHDAPVHVVVDGIAASIASVIAMAGDTVTMNPHTRMMIHRPWSGVIGDEDDMAKESDVLHKIGEDIAGIYRDRGDSRINWMARMKDETWFSAEEAVAVGLADQVDDTARSAQNSFDLSRFRNVPADLANAGTAPPEGSADPTPTKRTAEQALRDVGFSGREAKAIVATGWVTLEARDESEQEPAGESTDAPDVTDETADDATGMVAADEMPIDLARARLQLALAR